jgi:diketogulonate reductase-like aldo/keto reductase
MLDHYFNAGFSHIDTALTYSGGKTEKMLGDIMPPGSERAQKCTILATKVGPWQGTASMTGNGGLSPAQLREKVLHVRMHVPTHANSHVLCARASILRALLRPAPSRHPHHLIPL